MFHLGVSGLCRGKVMAAFVLMVIAAFMSKLNAATFYFDWSSYPTTTNDLDGFLSGSLWSGQGWVKDNTSSSQQGTVTAYSGGTPAKYIYSPWAGGMPTVGTKGTGYAQTIVGVVEGTAGSLSKIPLADWSAAPVVKYTWKCSPGGFDASSGRGLQWGLILNSAAASVSSKLWLGKYQVYASGMPDPGSGTFPWQLAFGNPGTTASATSAKMYTYRQETKVELTLDRSTRLMTVAYDGVNDPNLTNIAIPGTDDLYDWKYAGFWLKGGSMVYQQVETVAAVPEPAMLAATGLVIGGVAIRRIRRRRGRQIPH